TRIPPSPLSTLFPYTTLFRSRSVFAMCISITIPLSPGPPVHRTSRKPRGFGRLLQIRAFRLNPSLCPVDTNETEFAMLRRRFSRSEEHTSELQSQSNLVCRLL